MIQKTVDELFKRPHSIVKKCLSDKTFQRVVGNNELHNYVCNIKHGEFRLIIDESNKPDIENVITLFTPILHLRLTPLLKPELFKRCCDILFNGTEKEYHQSRLDFMVKKGRFKRRGVKFRHMVNQINAYIEARQMVDSLGYDYVCEQIGDDLNSKLEQLQNEIQDRSVVPGSFGEMDSQKNRKRNELFTVG